MGEPKQADPRRISQHSQDLNNEVVPHLKKAGDTINGDGVYNLEGSDFSPACIAASAAYPISVQFAFEDVKMLMSTVKGYSEKIVKAADNYKKTEQKNADHGR
ncbi:hypothetical protein ACFHW2_21005 [Actinomadura sp. LOL_016]|uniref:hypothetical protein n=1 Tax=unclassified Actinomadura TaxID=2626254 RepID=UPI003A810435